MKMLEPVAEVRESRPVNANGATVKAAFLFDTTLPSGTKLYDKQALIDLLEEAAKECDQERLAHATFKNYQAAFALAEVADSIRKLKEKL
jgi:hypothetical protein